MVLKKTKVLLPEGYRPSEEEEYMNPLQLEYFRKKLLDWERQLNSESTETIDHMKEASWNQPDTIDRAALTEASAFELRTRDRYRKLLDKIRSALMRIDSGGYGYCEETGEPIGIRRLEARPIATLSLEAQEQHERFERSHSDDD